MSSYGSSYGYAFRSSVTKWVYRLLVANSVVFLAAFLLRMFRVASVAALLGLQPSQLLERPWSILTYAFVHAGVLHFFFNMLALYFLGPRLEERWGSRGFITYYLVSAAGSAVLSFIQPNALVVGASGAVYGLLVAWAVYWPDDELLFFVFPVKVKWLVLGFAVFSLLMSADPSGGAGTAHLAHLGGLITGWLYLKSPWAPNTWGDLPARRKPPKKQTSKALVPWSGKKKEEAARAAPPPAAAAAGPTSTRRSARAERELLDDVDRILDKISAQGLSSLTPEERARLDEVSRRYRTN